VIGPLTLLARTDDWVVIAKPPGLLVHRSPMARGERVFALQLLRDQLGQHVYPTSRLDRPASGCLAFALSSEGARTLQAAMAHPTAVKTYVAQVRGMWLRGGGQVLVKTPMKDDNGRWKRAETLVDCLGAQLSPRCSLLRAQPRTGRFHQVRRHVRDLGHPILADQQHGDGRVNRSWRNEGGLRRLALHCVGLDLPTPSGGRLVVRCPLFEDLARVWSVQAWWDQACDREPTLTAPPLPLLAEASSQPSRARTAAESVVA